MLHINDSSSAEVQVLQDAEQWCPNAEKVFVSPAGQVVDPETVQQELAAQADQSQPPGTSHALSSQPASFLLSAFCYQLTAISLVLAAS